MIQVFIILAANCGMRLAAMVEDDADGEKLPTHLTFLLHFCCTSAALLLHFCCTSSTSCGGKRRPNNAFNSPPECWCYGLMAIRKMTFSVPE